MEVNRARLRAKGQSNIVVFLLPPTTYEYLHRFMFRRGDQPVPGYVLEKFLGRGQYGEVWRTSAPGGARAALKFVDLSGNSGLKELRSLLRVKGVRHPHLMPVLSMWLLDDEGHVMPEGSLEKLLADASSNDPRRTLAVQQAAPTRLVVAMLLGDKNLADRLAEAQREGSPGIPAKELLTYMEEAAKAVDYLNAPQHDLGEGLVSIIHCDIKPANIMLVGGSVVICDFGMARMLGDTLKATATGMHGSPAYMAPESIRKHPGSETDQYSLAITYYELRTGRLPFVEESYLAVLESHEKGTLVFNALPDAEREVMEIATALDPEDRYENTQEMVAALRKAIGDNPGEIPKLDTPINLDATKSTGRSSGRSTANEQRRTRKSGRRQKEKRSAPVRSFLYIATVVMVVLVGVMLVPSIRGRVVSLVRSLDGDPGEVERKSEKSDGSTDVGALRNDLVAAIAGAESSIVAGNWDEADSQLQKLNEQLLAVGGGVSDLLLRVRSGRFIVSTIREPDLATLNEEALQLSGNAADLPPAIQPRFHLAALRTWAAREPMREVLSQQLQPLGLITKAEPPLNDEEQQAYDGLKQNFLSRLSTSPPNDEERLTLIRSIWPQGIELNWALAKAEKQIQDGEFANAIAAIAKIEAETKDQSILDRATELRMIVELGDAKTDPATAINRFAELSPRVQNPDRLLQALLDRASSQAPLLDSAMTAIGKLVSRLPPDIATKVTMTRNNRLTSLLEKLINEPNPDFTAIGVIGNALRASPGTSPWTAAAWAESQVRLIDTKATLSNKEWLDVEEAVKRAVAAVEDRDHRGYVKYVQSIVSSGSPISGQKENAGKWMLEAIADDRPWLASETRRKGAQKLLFDAAKRAGLPNDSQCFAPPGSHENTGVIIEYLEGIRRLARSPSSLWKGCYLAAIVQQPDDKIDWNSVVAMADELLISKDALQVLRSNELEQQVLLAAARGHHQLYPSTQSIPAAEKSVLYRSVLLQRVLKMTQDRPSDLIVYEQLVSPAWSLIEQAKLADASTGELARGIARVAGTRGELLLKDRDVAKSLQTAGTRSPHAVAEESFRLAIRLDPQPSYLIGLGTCLKEARRGTIQEEVPRFQQLADDILKLDPNNPGGTSLRGFSYLIESRSATGNSRRLELLNQAVAAYESALQQPSADSDVRRQILIDLSAAFLELAFSTKIANEKRPFLDKAVTYGKDAVELNRSVESVGAYVALGHAYEDQALYLQETERYDDAIRELDNAYRAAIESFNSEFVAMADFARARARFRRVQKLLALRSESRTQITNAAAEGDLSDALRQFENAISIWGEHLEVQSTEQKYAEAQIWVGQLHALSSQIAGDNKSKLDLLKLATTRVRKGVDSAAKSNSPDWAKFMVLLGGVYYNISTTVPRESPEYIEALREAKQCALEVLQEADRTPAIRPVDNDDIDRSIDWLILAAPNDSDSRIRVIDENIHRFPVDGSYGSRFRVKFLALKCNFALQNRSKDAATILTQCHKDAQTALDIAELTKDPGVILQGLLATATVDYRDYLLNRNNDKGKELADRARKATARAISLAGDSYVDSIAARLLNVRLGAFQIEDLKTTNLTEQKRILGEISEIMKPIKTEWLRNRTEERNMYDALTKQIESESKRLGK